MTSVLTVLYSQYNSILSHVNIYCLIRNIELNITILPVLHFDHILIISLVLDLAILIAPFHTNMHYIIRRIQLLNRTVC